MNFEEILDHAMAMLQRRRRVAYRTLQVQFNLDDSALEALKDELIYSQKLAVDEAGRVLVWTGDAVTAPAVATALAGAPAPAPLTYTPPYLAEQILASKSALEGERKQVTVLFADLKGSMELLADRICRRHALRVSRPSICGSPCARRSYRLATLGVSWHICARPRPSRRPSTTRVG